MEDKPDDSLDPGELKPTLDTDIERGRLTITQLLDARGIKGGVVLDEKGKSSSCISASSVLVDQAGRRYEIGKVVAKGGMGAILKAKDLNIRRTVAMKVLLDPKKADDAKILRFIEEAQITGQMEHPSIVPVHELGVDAHGSVFYTMKLVKGVTLDAILEGIRTGDAAVTAKYPLGQLLAIFLKACDAVAFAHMKNVVHRDLKPENIMVGEFGEVLVMDWGLGKVLARDDKDPSEQEAAKSKQTTIIDSARVGEAAQGAAATLDGAVMGTPLYMAPEQAYGKVSEIDRQSDIYSLGAILYSILTLHPPVSGSSVNAILLKVVQGQIDPAEKYEHDRDNPLRHLPGGRIPPALSSVAMKAMSINKQERYQSVKDIQKEIEAYLGGFATRAEHAGIARQIWLLIRRHRTFSAATALIALLTTGAAFSIHHAREMERREREKSNELSLKAAEAAKNEATAKLNLLEEENKRKSEWLPVCEFDFTKEKTIDDRFETVFCPANLLESEGRKEIPVPQAAKLENGSLTLFGRLGSLGGGLTVMRWKEPVADDIRVECTLSGDKCVSIAVGGDSFRGYRIVYNGFDNNITLDTLRDLRWSLLVSNKGQMRPPDQTRTISVEKSGSFIRASVDGILQLDYFDPVILAGQGQRNFAIGTYFSETSIYKLKVDRQRSPQLVSPLEAGREMLRRKLFKEAEDFFRGQMQVHGNDELGIEAGLLLGLSQKYQGNVDGALDILQAVATGNHVPFNTSDRIRRINAIALEQVSQIHVEREQFIDAADAACEAERIDVGSSSSEKIREILVDRLRKGAKVITVGRDTYNTTSILPQSTQDEILSAISRLPIKRLNLIKAGIADISPLKGMPLAFLDCGCNQINDLAPLRGMKLESLHCWCNKISDISPLKGMHIKELSFPNNLISDLSPLKGMSLSSLDFFNNRISDLSPLKGMPIVDLVCAHNQISDISPLKGMPILRLTCSFNMISDLSPLKGKQLIELRCDDNQISDLSALCGMPLKHLSCDINKISDLSPLNGMPLERLTCSVNIISELSPVKGMPLKFLNCEGNQISDISVLAGMPLVAFSCTGNKISDFSPLRGMPLNSLSASGIPLTGTNADIISNMQLGSLFFSPETAAQTLLDSLKNMKSLKSLNSYTPDKFFEIWPDIQAALQGEKSDLKKYADEWGGHRYLLVPIPMSYEKAEEFCRSQGGYLASPSTKEEMNAVMQIAKERLAPSMYDEVAFRIGAIWSQNEKCYHWISGESWDVGWSQGYFMAHLRTIPTEHTLAIRPLRYEVLLSTNSFPVTFMIEWPE